MSEGDKAPELKVVAIPDMPKVLNLNVSRWNYRDFMKFSQLTSKDVVSAYRKGQEIIESWGYSVPLSDENALAKLPIEEGAKVIRAIMQRLETAFEGLSIADVSVDFSRGGWNTLDMQRFFEALAAFDYETVETMVYQVAKVDGLKAGDTLPLAEGAMIVKAISKRYKDLMAGKF
jgi:hypothetical protein